MGSEMCIRDRTPPHIVFVAWRDGADVTDGVSVAISTVELHFQPVGTGFVPANAVLGGCVDQRWRHGASRAVCEGCALPI